MIPAREKPGRQRRERPRQLSGLWQHRGVRAALITIGVLVALFALLRFGVALGVKLWLETHRAADIKIGAISIDPFTGRVNIRNASMKVPDGDPLVVGEASLRLAVIPLLFGRRELTFEYVTISGIRVSFVREAGGTIKISGLPIAPRQDKTSEAPIPWVIAFDRLELTESSLAFLGYNLAIELPVRRVNINGRLTFGEGDPDINLDADAALGNFSAQIRRPGEMTVIAAAQATIDGLQVESTSGIGVRQVELRDLRLAQPLVTGVAAQKPPAVVQVPQLVLQQIAYNSAQPAVAIESVALHAPSLYLARDARQRWYAIDPLRAALDETKRGLQPVGDTPSDDRNPVGWRINAIKSIGTTTLTFVDQGVRPAYRETLTLDRLEITDIDSVNLATWLQLDLAGKVGRHAPLKVAIRAQPFAPKLTLTGKATLEDFDLPPLSGYLAQLMGYHVKSGRLDVESELKIRDDESGSEHHIVLNNIHVTEVDKERAQALQTQTSMPLDTALSMLRDKQNNVRLKLPMSGNIRDPDFHIGDAINRALGTAMETAALGYAAFALQPFGALLAVIQLADGGTALALDPVPFEPGKATLESTPARYLERVAALLAERPAVRLRLCPVSTRADSAAGAKDLLQLGHARAQVVEDMLVARHNIERKRLFTCHPETTDNPEAKPRVDLAI